MNIFIFIRQFKIIINNIIIKKFIYIIIKLELIFYQNYNLFIYFKFIIIIFGKIFKEENFLNFDNFNNENNFFKIKNKLFKKDFR